MRAVLLLLGRANRRHPWSHNSFFTRRILREARRTRRSGGTTALDIGCGTGDLALRLRDVFPVVTGVEPDPATARIAEARVATTEGVRIERVAFPAESIAPAGFVSLVAVLHHLPLAQGVRAARDAVEPGGRLVIVGAYRETRRDLPLALLSLVLNPVIGFVRHPRVAATPPLEMSAPTAEPIETYREIRAVLRDGLPGVRMRRHLFWRYVAVWTRSSID